MGKIFGSQTKTTQNPYEQNPWEPQQDYLKSGFEGSQGALDNAVAQNSSVADPTADLNSGQQSAIQGMTDLGMNQAGDVSQLALQSGMQGIQNVGQYATNANQLFGDAGQDQTGQIIANAGQYADNPYMQSQIDAVMGDLNRGFQRDVGSINAAASGTGNINSTRAAVLESRALDDSMDRGAQISAQMRGGAYDRGLGLAADMSGRGFQQQLAANGQVGQSGQSGLDAAMQGYGVGQEGFKDALGAQTLLQTQDQNEITGKTAQAQREMDLFQQYMQTIGGSYGGKGYTSETSESPSIFQQVSGAAIGFAGL